MPTKLPADMNWRRFMQELKNEGKRKATIQKYKYYASLMSDVKINDPDEVNEWLVSSYNKQSVKAGISAMLRTYYRVMNLGKDKIKSVKFKSKTNKFYITEEELHVLLEVIDDNEYLNMLTELVFYTGMRVGVVLNLTTDMIKFKKKGIEVPHDIHGNKAKMEFFVPIPEKTLVKLQEFIEKYKIKGLVFPPSKLLRRKKIKLHNLTKLERIEILITQEMRKYSRKIRNKIEDKTLADRWNEISTKISPHKLRHSYGNIYIEKGGDRNILQRNLGHAHSVSTDRYISIKKTRQVEDNLKVFGN